MILHGTVSASNKLASVAPGISRMTHDTSFLVDTNRIDILYVSPNGNTMYAGGDTDDSVLQLDFGTPWDVSTLSWSTLTAIAVTASVDNGYYLIETIGTTDFTLIGAASNTVGLKFKKNLTAPLGTGTVEPLNYLSYSSEITGKAADLYVSDDGSVVVVQSTVMVFFKYDISTPGDLSTGSFTAGQTFDPGAGGGGFTMSPDGVYIFTIMSGTDTITRYTLSTAWDFSTETLDAGNYSCATEETIPQHIRMHPNGRYMFISGTGGNTIVHAYSLDTPWVISTGVTYGGSDKSLNIQTTVAACRGFGVSNDLKTLIALSGSKYVHEYN